MMTTVLVVWRDDHVVYPQASIVDQTLINMLATHMSLCLSTAAFLLYMLE